jgi:hypothetical protein
VARGSQPNAESKMLGRSPAFGFLCLIPFLNQQPLDSYWTHSSRDGNVGAYRNRFTRLLACADSRVPVELIFDQTIGHIIVARVAGNVVTPESIASLKYGGCARNQGHSGSGGTRSAVRRQFRGRKFQVRSTLFIRKFNQQLIGLDLTLQRLLKQMPKYRQVSCASPCWSLLRWSKTTSSR